MHGVVSKGPANSPIPAVNTILKEQVHGNGDGYSIEVSENESCHSLGKEKIKGIFKKRNIRQRHMRGFVRLTKQIIADRNLFSICRLFHENLSLVKAMPDVFARPTADSSKKLGFGTVQMNEIVEMLLMEKAVPVENMLEIAGVAKIS